MPGHLQHPAIHRQVVMAGGDDQVCRTNQSVLIDRVVVEEGAARRFGDADALKLLRAKFARAPLSLRVAALDLLMRGRWRRETSFAAR